jgi:WD repeat-containing protein 61
MYFLAHTEATWGIAWTCNDSVVSISADGAIKHWDSTSGEVSQSLPPHALGLVSLSVSRDGQHVLYNSLEGLTSLWDLETGKTIGRSESYVRSGHDIEPSKSVRLTPQMNPEYLNSSASLVCILTPQR